MILVTGATGNVGRHLVARLLEAGIQVRALTRHPEAADLPAGAEIFVGDLGRPETLETALRGVESVFLVWPFLMAEGAPAVLDAIGRHARRVVYLRMLADGWPSALVDALLSAPDHQPAIVTSTVEKLTGTVARTFRDWAVEHADSCR